MESLTTLELALLERLINKYPSLKSHIPHLLVSSRQTTDAGMVVNMIYNDAGGKPETSDIDALFSDQDRIHVKGLQHGLGYVIDVTDGLILFIELMTYDERWNGRLDDYTIAPFHAS